MAGDETLIKVVAIVALAAVLVVAIAGLTVVAVLTDRDLFHAETFTFGGVIVLGALGGASWIHLRRRRVRLEVRDGDDDG